ncbi:uncharacterized protein [Haliotis cracherodii]|uniref:uncharacterized protein n=1 Tax=Haliotis cracherodii TaxID=6455 RepID=UPI0039EA7ABC
MMSDAMAGMCQTVCNSSPTDVAYPGANTQANHEQRSPSSSQELSWKTTPMRSGAEESDSSGESKTSDLFPDESILGNDFRSCEENLMRFAEILYKCALCTSLPSILTSKGSFLAHVTSQHLTKQASFQDCSQCDLKFGTDEDLRSHIDCAHAKLCGERVEADKLSDTESVDEAATPSSGMEERLSTPKPPLYVANSGNKPRLESPNQSKKDFPCNKYQLVKQTAPVVKVNDLPKSENISKIQKLTDQIVQAQTPGSQANLLQSWSSMSSFTPEFGRYTKLVREGGNIVYFCQVCNWKCQVKAAFQAHCNGPHHNNKVRIADQNNPHRKRGGSSNVPASTSPGLAGGSPSNCRSPTGLLTFVNKPEVEAFRTDTPCDSQNGGTMDMKRSDGVPMPGNGVHMGQGMSDMPFLQGLLSSHRTDEKRESGSNFVFQKRWENDSTHENNHQDSQFERTTRTGSPSFMNPGSGEHSPAEKDPNSTPRNKRKRPAPVCLRNQIGSGNSWSDSDSDECADREKNCESSSDSDQPDAKKQKHAESSPVLRDDFHSRLMKKALSGHANVEKTLVNSHPLGPAEHTTPYFQNSFRNRLFASAFGASFGPMYGWFGQPNPLFQSPVCSNDENVSREKGPIDPYDNLVHYGSKLFQNCFTPFNYTGKHRQVSEALASRNDTRPQSDTSDKGDNSPKSDDASCDNRTVFKQEPIDGDEAVFRCSMCEFTCQDIVDYRHHFMAEHGVDGADSLLGESQFSTMNEGWKMSKIRDTLPDLLVECSKGNVSRDLLLQKISLLLGLPEVIHWGPACNKAVREVFQNSLAQRKGKYKKTYFFGVALIEQLQEQEELSDSENVTYQPLRDMSQDLERILEHLPDLVYWTGECDTGVSRDELLELLAEKIEEKDVQHWGVQCNRAMRMLFPEVQMKRKGKYKTTVFFGVDYSKNLQKQSFIPTKRGRPRKLNDDEDDQPYSAVSNSPFDKSMLAWRAQMQHMKYLSQPRFQHHWKGEDGTPLLPQLPPREGATEISKDYNFLAAELRGSYTNYHPPTFGYNHGYSATVQHKPPETELETDASAPSIIDDTDPRGDKNERESPKEEESVGK